MPRDRNDRILVGQGSSARRGFVMSALMVRGGRINGQELLQFTYGQEVASYVITTQGDEVTSTTPDGTLRIARGPRALVFDRTRQDAELMLSGALVVWQCNS